MLNPDLTCGLGCGRALYKDGYCLPCWSHENLKAGRPVAILPKTGYTRSVTADEIPDTFPKDWT